MHSMTQADMKVIQLNSTSCVGLSSSFPINYTCYQYIAVDKYMYLA